MIAARDPDFRSFGLSLGRTAWRIEAARSVEDWAREFARILSLDDRAAGREPEGDGDRWLMYLLPDPGGTEELPETVFQTDEGRGLPRAGWTSNRLQHLKMWRHPEARAVLLELKYGRQAEERILTMSEACLPFFLRAIDSGGLPLHAALLCRDGGAVVLAAPGGTGKSTCARRVPPPWMSMGDDLVLVDRKRAHGSDYVVHPFPTWSDYVFKRSEGAWEAGAQCTLRAVFFLSRAVEDRVIPLGKGEAAISLCHSALQILAVPLLKLPPPETRRLRSAVFDNACLMARNLSVYRLELTLAGAFWKEIESVFELSPEE
ncbi:MAG: SynChlorMet cassette protein ScmC [Candidatus Aminicenantes bacterium]|nr:SynChlorMet cassette protein ScmC [Candidatus Aminicenantes bacterium]